MQQPPHAPVALVTDFGHQDWFVGSLKASIIGIGSRVPILDICHLIPPGDIRRAALLLKFCQGDFPLGTVFCAVVDPGVGSERAAIALRCQGRYFVGPDNGLFSLLGSIPSDIVCLDEPKYHGIQSSHTFHGRDIFAPVSGYLSMGVPLSHMGSSKSDYIKLPSPKIEETAHSIFGEIVYYDRFGNGITSIPNDHPLLSQKVTVVLDGTEKVPLERFFQAVTCGKTVAYPGSCGYLEVGINQGSLRGETGLEIGTEVRVFL